MLLSNLNLLATAPGGVARLRELILTLAVQGKLVPQDPKDEPASELLKKIRAEKDRLIAEGKIKRDKSLPPIAEDGQPFVLPAGWCWARFPELGEFGRGKSKHRPRNDPALFAPPKYPLIQTGEVSRAKGVVKEVHSYYSDLGLAQSRMWPKGTLCITIAANIAESAVLGFDSCFPDSVVGFVPANAIGNVEYFLLFVETARADLLAFAPATAQKNINLEILSSLLIPIPPLNELSRIVTRVEELMRLCDALEAKGQLEATQHAQLVSTLLATLTDSETPAQLADNWHRIATHFDLLLDRPEAVDALEQTILQLAVRGLLVPQDPQDEPASELLKKIRAEKDKLIAEGKIKRDKPLPSIVEDEQPFALPSGWEWTQTGYLVNDSEAGWSPTCIGSPRRSGHWGVLKVSAVSWGAFDASANKELPEDLAPRPECEVKDGDFLLSRANTEELVARSVVVGTAEPKLMLSDKIIRLDVSSLMNRDFLNLCNNASHARAHYIANASGTSSSMKNVSREVVLRTPVPLPPLAEQSRIVTRVAQLRRLCADLRQRLSASQCTQAHLAEALVDTVASGLPVS